MTYLLTAFVSMTIGYYLGRSDGLFIAKADESTRRALRDIRRTQAERN